MSPTRALHFTNRHRRNFVSSLFGLTFLASVVTVSASAILPCPAHNHGARYADGRREGVEGQRSATVVEKRPRRWIEETGPRRM
ncbi:hypothetical protein B0H21DRAFT_684439 [Amylocystis lapponica]|nr:hypothetical protein B0H21DRAFT_684439 [Amylocystis lapponica]